MEFHVLKKLVQAGEGQHLEFKKKANHPEKIIKELVAFANANGGLLVLGADDDGTLSGSRDIEGEAFVLESAIDKWIRPKLHYNKEILSLSAKKGLALFHVQESSRKPHFVKLPESQGKGVAYIRHQEESLQASRELREIIRRRQKPRNIRFEYGEKERQLMLHLEDHDDISIQQFSQIAAIPKFVAARTLVRLVLANLLDVLPTGSCDLYRLKDAE